jgi:hypothetical protein
LFADTYDDVMKARAEKLAALKSDLSLQLLQALLAYQVPRVPDPVSLTPEDGLNPMMIPREQIRGRQQDIQEAKDMVNKTNALLLWGGPGEGKTSLSRVLSGILYDAGSIPGGAFEVDLTCAGESLCSLSLPGR